MKLSFVSRFSCLGLLAASVTASHGQKVFTSDGKEIPFADVTMQGNNLAWRVKDAATGNTRTLNVPNSMVIRLDFPVPTDLQDAEDALNRGDTAVALEKVEPVLKDFSAFKPTPGSYYVAASLIKLEALAVLKKGDDFDRVRAELKSINLAKTDQIRLTAAEALLDYAKEIYGPALTSVTNLIPQTDDASVLAKLYNILGDIQMKQSAYENALESYLSVSVFYGSQADQLPRAELGAGRALMKMQRYEDARDMFVGIRERYPTSQYAQAAKGNLDESLKLLGKNADENAKAAEKADQAAMEKEKAKEQEKMK